MNASEGNKCIRWGAPCREANEAGFCTLPRCKRTADYWDAKFLAKKRSMNEDK